MCQAEHMVCRFVYKALCCLCVCQQKQVPNSEIDKTGQKFFAHWEPDKKVYTLQVYFKSPRPGGLATGPEPPRAPPNPMPGVTTTSAPPSSSGPGELACHNML